MTLTAYQRTQSISESPRSMERRLVAHVTGRMTSARDSGQLGVELVDVLHHNREMWQAFSAMCAAPGNGLPPALRAGIISLALWVDRHSTAVIAGKETIDALIEVNRTIGEGLNGEPQGVTALAVGQ